MFPFIARVRFTVPFHACTAELSGWGVRITDLDCIDNTRQYSILLSSSIHQLIIVGGLQPDTLTLSPEKINLSSHLFKYRLSAINTPHSTVFAKFTKRIVRIPRACRENFHFSIRRRWRVNNPNQVYSLQRCKS